MCNALRAIDLSVLFVLQIRKMVATALAVARGVLPAEFIDASLCRPCRTRTPVVRPPPKINNTPRASFVRRRFACLT